MRVLAVDDEPLAIERMQILCARLPGIELIGTANDGPGALRLIEVHRPDVLLLDIAMPGMTGLQLAAALPQDASGSAPAIIFITAFDQFALAAFEVAAVDYLMKPIDAARLARGFERARQRQTMPAPVASPQWIAEFWVPQRGEMVRVAADDVEHVQAERDYMRLTTATRSFLIHETISTLEARLDPAKFVRIHRSVIVRRDHVARLFHGRSSGWQVELVNGLQLPVGRTHAAGVKALLTGH
nr:LytTR family DNA-binding domain-containing protein [Polymorphobacter multimanifer]